MVFVLIEKRKEITKLSLQEFEFNYWSLITMVPAIMSPKRLRPLVIKQRGGQHEKKFLKQESMIEAGLPVVKLTTLRPIKPFPKLCPSLIPYFHNA